MYKHKNIYMYIYVYVCIYYIYIYKYICIYIHTHYIYTLCTYIYAAAPRHGRSPRRPGAREQTPPAGARAIFQRATAQPVW